MPKVEINANAIIQSVIVALMLGVLGAGFSTYMEAKRGTEEIRRLETSVTKLEAKIELMRVELDRSGVYVDQLWEESRRSR